MKLEKATEFYSAYYEGVLEPGIKVQFEAALESNPSIAADYAEFVASMEDLGAFGQVEVPIPDDLHELVSRRLDKHIYESKQNAKASWFERFRLQLVGGVAAVALIASVFFLNQGGKEFSGGVAGRGPSSIELSTKNGAPVVSYTPAQKEIVRVVRAHEGEVVKEVQLDRGRPFTMTLENSDAGAEALRIETSGNAQPVYVAVPGTQRSKTAEGMGTLVKLATAMADYFQLPVQLDARDRDRSVRWTFSPGSVVDSKVEGVHLTISAKNGLIRLGD